jgi:hypothetical protein
MQPILARLAHVKDEVQLGVGEVAEHQSEPRKEAGRSRGRRQRIALARPAAHCAGAAGASP